MPYPPPSRALPGPRRRTLLASAAGAALLAGCSPASDDPDGGTGGSPSLAERARARAARDSEGLVGRYDAVLAAHPALEGLVAPLRAEAARHVEAFGGGASGASASPSASPSGSGSPSPSASAPVPAVPSDERDALAELAAAERTLADQRARTLLEMPGELARLLASVAAAGAAHAFLLTEGAK